MSSWDSFEEDVNTYVERHFPAQGGTVLPLIQLSWGF